MTTPAPRATPAQSVDINTISRYINENPTLRTKLTGLLCRGFIGNLEQVFDQIAARLDADADALEAAQTTGVCVWDTLAASFPHNYFTEVCIFSHRGDLYALGPSGDKHVALTRFEIEREGYDPVTDKDQEDEMCGQRTRERCNAKSLIPLKGHIPPAIVLFRKMPLSFVHGDRLYLGYTCNQERWKMVTLDLTTWEMAPLPIRGPEPEVEHAMAYEGCFLNDTIYLLASPTTLYTLPLGDAEWRRTGIPSQPQSAPGGLSGSSNIWNGKMLVFGQTDGVVFHLDLTTLIWSKRETKNSPKIALREAHLIRPLNPDTMVLIRMTDNSEVWFYHLITATWERKEAVGLRAGNYSTNPSYMIRDGVAYVLGGQSAGKHTLYDGTATARRLVAMPTLAPAQPPPVPVENPAPALAQPPPVPAANPAVALAQPPPVPVGNPDPVPAPVHPPEEAAPMRQLTIREDRRNMLSRVVLERKPAVTPKDILAKRLAKTLDDRYTDVTFSFQDGTRVKAHRSLLSSNPVFDALFSSEPSKTEFAIGAWDSVTFSALIHHFYEKLDLATDAVDPFNLYRLACEYREGSLKVKLENHITTKNEVAAVLEAYRLTMNLGDSPCNNRIKRKAKEEILREFPKLSKTQAWADFIPQNPQLLPELLVALKERKTVY